MSRSPVEVLHAADIQTSHNLDDGLHCLVSACCKESNRWSGGPVSLDNRFVDGVQYLAIRPGMVLLVATASITAHRFTNTRDMPSFEKCNISSMMHDMEHLNANSKDGEEG